MREDCVFVIIFEVLVGVLNTVLVVFVCSVISLIFTIKNTGCYTC